MNKKGWTYEDILETGRWVKTLFPSDTNPEVTVLLPTEVGGEATMRVDMRVTAALLSRSAESTDIQMVT